MKPHERIILPLDVSNVEVATSLVEQLVLHVGVFKVGFEAIYSAMANLLSLPDKEIVSYLWKIRYLAEKITAKKAFLDVKLADIPNTVEKAVKAIARLKPKMFNIHASAGKEVIARAVANKGDSLLFGVTVLTSIDKDECASIFGARPNVKVLKFVKMLVDGGADGVICAPKEGIFLREDPHLDKFIIACPNIRPEWAATKEERNRVKDDQNIERQMTPGEAIKAGIDMLVIGRPILNPPAEIGGAVEAVKRIVTEIEQAQKEM
jgi:orotidine-5'-phosphate decarboxylase